LNKNKNLTFFLNFLLIFNIIYLIDSYIENESVFTRLNLIYVFGKKKNFYQKYPIIFMIDNSKYRLIKNSIE